MQNCRSAIHSCPGCALSSKGATKTDTPLLTTAQSVSVVTRQQMEDQNVVNVNQALNYTPGVFTNFAGAAGRYDTVALRGFHVRVVLPVEAFEVARDCGDGLALRLVGLHQHLDRLPLDERERGVDLARDERVVDGAVGRDVDVRRAVVAVHAVHPARLARRQLLGRQVDAFEAELADGAVHALQGGGQRFPDGGGVAGLGVGADSGQQ